MWLYILVAQRLAVKADLVHGRGVDRALDMYGHALENQQDTVGLDTSCRRPGHAALNAKYQN